MSTIVLLGGNQYNVFLLIFIKNVCTNKLLSKNLLVANYFV